MKALKAAAIVVVTLGVAFSAYLLVAHGGTSPQTDPYWDCMAGWGFHPNDDPSAVNVDRLGLADEACR